MIKTIYSPHTQILPFPSRAGLALACMVSMVTKQEALPLVKALAIIIRRCTKCREAGRGEEGILSHAKPWKGVTQLEKSHLLVKMPPGFLTVRPQREAADFNLGKHTDSERRDAPCPCYR